MLLTLLSLFTAFTVVVYLWLKRNSEYWRKRNVPNPQPNFLLGNITDALVMKKNLIQIYTEIYNDFQQFPYVGIFKARVPGLLIRDPKLSHDILTKDFLSFERNDMQIAEETDPLIGKNPFFLTGQKWKTTRSQLTICFTAGKMKLMLPLMIKVTEDMVKYIDSQIALGFSTMEAKELSAKFTTDAVASCGFGLEAKSFSDTEAEFRKVGEMIFQPSWADIFPMLLITLFPSLVNVLRIRIVPIKADRYFRQLVESALRYRAENEVVRNDFLNNVNQIREQNPDYTIEDVTSHALSFFIDGYETSSIVLCFIIYELASNPYLQEKLRKEVDEIMAKHKNELTYECLQEMIYMDCVISESLRLHPPGAVLTKMCTKDFFFPAINGNKHDLLVKSGTPIIIPVYGIHRDPKYYQNPEVFDPDRFSDANKASIKKGTYFPFGDGPRICLGQRFALCQIKVALASLIKNFEMRVNKKTKEPLEIDEKYFMLLAKGGIWIDYYKRK